MKLRNGLGLVLVIAAGWLAVTAATPAKTSKGDAARGKYLVSIMGCGDCHTPGTFYGAPDMKRWLSGSELGWNGPWGVVHPANLTSDMETGLGKWSEDDIAKAIQTGVRPDGRLLAPIMPWQTFANATKEDAHAIAAYLKTLPPVKHKLLPLQPPGVKPEGACMVFPPPPAWDAPRTAPKGAGH